MSIFCGTFMLMEPVVSLFTLTGILLVYFIVDGLINLYQGIKRRPQEGWGWVVTSGVSSLLLGGLLAYQWPDAGFYAVGILVGVRLLISGWSVAMLGMAGDNLGEGIAAITEEERNALREHADALVAELDEQEARGPRGAAAPQPA